SIASRMMDSCRMSSRSGCSADLDCQSGSGTCQSAHDGFKKVAMKIHLICPVVFTFIACAGCASVQRARTTWDTPTFSEGEIRSKSWRDPQGKPVVFIDWSRANLKARGELLIVKYGDSESKVPTCLKFYRIVRRPGADVAEYD